MNLKSGRRRVSGRGLIWAGVVWFLVFLLGAPGTVAWAQDDTQGEAPNGAGAASEVQREEEPEEEEEDEPEEGEAPFGPEPPPVEALRQGLEEPDAPLRPFGGEVRTWEGPFGVPTPFGDPAAVLVEPPPSTGAAGGGILMNFQDAPLSAVLEHLSETAGFVIVQEAPVQGRVSILARQPLDAREAVLLLNTVLKERGYAAIRTGRILRIVTLDAAKVHNIPVMSGSDPQAVEATDEMITQVIPIRYADAVRLREDIASLLPSYAEMSANVSSNSLILTDTAANVRRIMQIVRVLDTHMSSVAEVRVFILEYANATAAARLINEIFQTEDQTARGRAQARVAVQRFRGPQAAQPQGEGEGARNQRVYAAADERTNTVVVSGPGDVLAVVEQVIRELDANPAEEEGVMVYPLKNATADDLAGVLNNLFSEQTTRGRTTTGTTRRTGTTTRQTGGTTGRTTGGRR